MKKTFSLYAVCWAICLALFNVFCFATPNEAAGMNKFGGAFWAGYIFITIAFIGQLVCAFFAFKSRDSKKFFYKIPLISISYTGLILMLIAGVACMAIPDLPNWVGIIICILILTFNVIALIKATAAAEMVSDIDEKVQVQTSFFKKLTADAQSLMNSAKSDALRAETKKVYEAIRYSDPMSDSAVSELDSQIERQFKAFLDAVEADDAELAKETADAVVEMVGRRNQKCKLSK